MERDGILHQLKENLERAQMRMKMYADRHQRHEEFNSEEWVYLKIRPYRQHSLGRRSFAKLSPKYFGPYQIIKKIRNVAYKLKLPETASIHLVFHVSQLKRAQGRINQLQIHPLSLDENMHWLA